MSSIINSFDAEHKGIIVKFLISQYNFKFKILVKLKISNFVLNYLILSSFFKNY